MRPALRRRILPDGQFILPDGNTIALAAPVAGRPSTGRHALVGVADGGLPGAQRRAATQRQHSRQQPDDSLPNRAFHQNFRACPRPPARVIVHMSPRSGNEPQSRLHLPEPQRFPRLAYLNLNSPPPAINCYHAGCTLFPRQPQPAGRALQAGSKPGHYRNRPPAKSIDGICCGAAVRGGAEGIVATVSPGMS